MGASQNYSVNLNINANTDAAKTQLQSLQKQLQEIANVKIDANTGTLTQDIQAASQAAMQLSAHLATATNQKTGNLDFTKFYSSIQKSGSSLEEYGAALQKMGPAGQKAFVNLADSISKSEIPLKRSSKLMDNMWANLKKTVGWQISSSMVNSFVGSMQQAVGYAKDLNSSLTDIRIVTGSSAEQMASFAKEANQAAKQLSTTTTDYTKASLIYYQQGLSDAEVKARTEATIKMANATGTSAQTVSDQMTAIWNNFYDGSKSLTYYQDVMTALGAATASSTDEISEGVNKFAATAKTVGLSYEYATAGLATVTAKTRESADVVGNSFKTLFSRIQGLSLGETLDDGTDLNKYSTALAKVGVAVKDSSGELRDMDDILDDLGETWGTLSTAQQSALAQTVGGARQYTQLMALMNNWDYFKENLQVAKSSEGTLDQQAAIYAESWQAASDRVRASWEGLWDSLIDSDGFIGALDMLSGFIDILTGMSEGLGGVTGLLGTFGGVLLKTFNSQIASNISDVAYSVKMLFPSQQEKVIKERNDWISSVQETLSTDKFTIGHENEVKATSQGLQGQINNSLAYSKYSSGMTQEQQMMYNMMQNNRQGIYNDYVAAGKRLDEAKNQQSDFVAKTFNSTLSKSFLDESLGDIGPEFIKAQEDAIQSVVNSVRESLISEGKSEEEISKIITKEKLINKNYTSKYGTELSQIAEYQANIEQAKNMASTNIYDRSNTFGSLSDIISNYKKKVSDSEAVMAQMKSSLGGKFGKGSNILNASEQNQMNQYNNAAWVKEVSSQKLAELREQSSNPQTFNQALKFQARSVDNLKASWTKIANMSEGSEQAQAFIDSLTEFTNTASNNMGATDFMKDMQNLATRLSSSDETIKSAAQSHLSKMFTDENMKSKFTAFLTSSNNVVAENVFEYLKNNSDFQNLFMSDYNGNEQAAKENFVREATNSFSNVSTAQRQFLEQQGMLNGMDGAMQDEMRRRQQEQSQQQKLQGAVSLTQGASQAVTAGLQLTSTIESLMNDTASVSSTISGLLGTFANGAMGINAVASGLNALGNVGMATGSKIGLAIAGITALASAAVKLYDKYTVSESEHQQNLITSSEELNNFTATTANHLELVKQQNEDYLSGIKEIESLSQDPTTLAEDIFESNKKALNLISEYGLTQSDYSVAGNGLIKINEDALNTAETSADVASEFSQYANILGQGYIDKEQSSKVDSQALQYLSQLQNNINTPLAELLREYQATLEPNTEITNAQINELVTSQAWQKAERETWELYKSGEIGGTNGQTYLDALNGINKYGRSDEVLKNISADYTYEAAAQTTANKIIADTYGASKAGSAAKANILAQGIQEKMSSAEQFLDTTSTSELTDEQKSEAIDLISAATGLSNIKITGVDDKGQIKYQQGDDESTATTVTRESLNALHAAQEITADSQKLATEANAKYNELYTDTVGESAAEAAANLGEFGTVAGASAQSLLDLNNSEVTTITNSKGEEINVQDKLNEIGIQDQIDSIQSVSDSLGLNDFEGVLDNTSVETLTTLGELMDTGDNAEALTNLFNGIIEASGEKDPEKIGSLLTALANMDFSENDYLNATNLLNILQKLGFNVSEGNLPAIYAWLEAITGLGAGEDLANSAKQITEGRNALNKVTPGGTVDAATKEEAAKAGLTDNWVKTGDDEYTYVGTQEDIDSAKSMANKAFTQSQQKIDTAQASYAALEASGALADVNNSYDSGIDLLTALGIGYSTDLDTKEYVYDANKNGNNAQNWANALGFESVEEMANAILNGSGLEAFSQFMVDGVMSESDQAGTVEDYIAGIESTSDMLQAIQDGTAGVVDENGLFTDGAIARAQAMTDTSSEYQQVMRDMANTQAESREGAEKYIEAQEALENITDENFGAAQKYRDIMNENKEAYDAYTEAQGQAELALAIESVANARSLDASTIYDMVQYIQELHSGDSEWAAWAKNNSTAIAEMAAEIVEASAASKEIQSNLSDWKKAISSKDITASSSAFKNLTNNLFKLIKAEDTLSGKTKKLGQYMENYLTKNMDKVKKAAEGDEEAYKELQDAMAIDSVLRNTNTTTDQATAAVSNLRTAMQGLGDDALQVGTVVAEGFNVGANGIATGVSSMNSGFESLQGGFNDLLSLCQGNIPAFQDAIGQMGYRINWIPVDATSENAPPDGTVWTLEKEDGYVVGATSTTVSAAAQDATSTYYTPQIVFEGGNTAGGGGSGGGGGGSEPKKVANKRKSQTVQRYKRNDYKKSTNKFSKSTEENKKDYLYGEQKIAQLEKINKLTEKEAHLNADRIKEARAYLEEDRNNLQKYLKKYGYDMKLEADGYLANYEEVWTDIYNQIAALYSDNLLDESESELEEQLKVMQEELEGALEDYEDSLQELYDTIEAYEDSLYEMYDNQVEQIEHRIEFKTELDSDELDYMDFILDSIGESAERAVDAIDAMSNKTSTLLDGIDTYKDAIQEAFDISDNPLQTLITNGIEGVLTEKQVELLRDSKDGLTDYMSQLLELRESTMEKLIETFDTWNEKLSSSLTTLEHYGSVLSYFKNIVDVVGKDVLGLSDKTMDMLEQSAIDTANDNLEATKANYENLVADYEYAQEQLQLARERNDESSIEQWEETIRTVKEEMESAEDAMMSALESTLTLITEQFETAMQRAVDEFNDAIYEHGGLEGLSNDYSLIRENADLMAADYEKIYNLSKLNRDITKTLDDTKIIAGKSRLISLQKEINELQKSNVELSQYDLEYLQAKYDLRLAEIELENAQNAKSQVRLSKDSEGNWSYVYTQSTDAVAEAEQKYEDALYAMQELSQDYLEEMSSSMVDTSSAMMEEISALRIQDFNSYEEYQAEIKAIQDKYAESLKLQENEMNKAIANSSDLYKNDWQNYSQYTGYKISAASDWVDTFKESTLGGLLDADTLMSNFGDTILGLADEFNKSLSAAGKNYFTNVEESLNTYGTSIKGFDSMITDATANISSKSSTAAEDVKNMATEMTGAFKDVSESISSWQTDFSLEIDKLLEEITTMIETINEAIKTSATLTTDNVNYELIGAADAIDLINATGKYGYWSTGSDGNGVKVDGKSTAFVDYLAGLVEEMDDALEAYYNIPSANAADKEAAKEALEEAIIRYNDFKAIVDRLYDVSDTNMPTSKYEKANTSSFDTGGYTGEWGGTGKIAMLHEKELILNKDDTANFLEAIGISRDLVNSVIELNARSSGMGLGSLTAAGAETANSQTLEQYVTITAEFPGVVNHNEIVEALSDLNNIASQYANRSK